MGLVLVIYDHIVTFSAERRYIWPAPPSFRKYAFLVNRYSVPLCLFLSFLPLSGFIGLTFSDTVRLLSALFCRLAERRRIRHVAGSSGSQGCSPYARWHSATHSSRFASPLSGISRRWVDL
jgi:hypothetical protein